jgi:hypothetical protein
MIHKMKEALLSMDGLAASEVLAISRQEGRGDTYRCSGGDR